MKDNIQHIFCTKKFGELTREEKDAISDLATNEVEYDNVAAFYSQIENAPITFEEPSIKVKKSLDEIFDKKYAKKSNVRLLWSVGAAASITAFLFITYFNQFSDRETKALAKNEVKKTQDNFEKSKSIKVDTGNMNYTITTTTTTNGASNGVDNRGLNTDNVVAYYDNSVAANGSASTNIQTYQWTTIPSLGSSIKSQDSFAEMEQQGYSTSFSSSVDGLYKSETQIDYSIPTSQVPELLDLLTSTF